MPPRSRWAPLRQRASPRRADTELAERNLTELVERNLPCAAAGWHPAGPPVPRSSAPPPAANRDRLIAGLDIGSSRTTAIIGEVVGDVTKQRSIKVLGVGQGRTTGMHRGVVSDIEETTRSIGEALHGAERMAGVKVREVYAGIGGEHVSAMTSSGIVAVCGAEIDTLDVNRATDVARAQPIPAGCELLHAIPQEYTIDTNVRIRDPIGMAGMRLETEVYLVIVGRSPAVNLRKSVERAGYSVRELVVEPLASALAVLTEDEKEIGVALVEIGAETTDLAVFPRREDQTSGHDRVGQQQRDQRHRAPTRRHAARRGAVDGAIRLRLRADGGPERRDRAAEHRRTG